MRIIIDMQGAQTSSRFRGIGRYTLSFVQAVVRNRGEHEVILVLNGLFPESVEPIRAAFEGLIPQKNIRLWHSPGPVCEGSSGNETRREVAELVREDFFLSLQPDLIHVTSLFEGYVDDAVTSIGRFDKQTPVSVTLYDLIPLLNSDHYLKPNPLYEQYYRRKLSHLQQATCFLAISEFSRQEGLSNLGIQESSVINVSTAIEPDFYAVNLGEDTEQRLRQKFNITRPFVLYTGATDERKNLPRLILAYAALPRSLRETHQLVFAGRLPANHLAELQGIAKTAGVSAEELVFTHYVSDEELVCLYKLCKLYVFPSWHEGFGLPVLEAMACGAPVICSNTSSLPEVIGLDEATFDPMDVSSIKNKLQQALEDEVFRNLLITHGIKQAMLFSWDGTAKRAISTWETITVCNRRNYLDASLREIRLYRSIAPYFSHQRDSDVAAISACLAMNKQAGIERQLLLDISELTHSDKVTDARRVVRSYLKYLLQSPPNGFRVEPVYASRVTGYRYARRFTQRFLYQSDTGVIDTPMRWQRGDIFFALDMQLHLQLENSSFYRQLCQEGLTVKFLVNNHFVNSNTNAFQENWLTMVAGTDGAICLSKTTLDSLTQQIEEFAVPRSPNFKCTWVQCGVDIDVNDGSSVGPTNAENIFKSLSERPTFLCASDFESVNKQQQILHAVEILWEQNIDVNLVFVGKLGLDQEALSDRLNNHRELNRRLFWLMSISGDYLEKIYAKSTCLVAAAVNDGFGLSLFEAARQGLPIIVRDIPVYREIAGEFTEYFRGDAPEDLAYVLMSWLDKYREKRHALSNNIPWLTWKQSTEILKFALVESNYLRRQLLVDISELVQRDAKSGIQRVVRSLLNEWFTDNETGYRIEPIFATHDHGYRYARKFMANLLGKDTTIIADEPIEYEPGDVFLGLDLAPAFVPAHQNFYQKLRSSGVIVSFVIYDLLPLVSEYFEKIHADAYSRWLEVATSGDMAICISESVSAELHKWLHFNKPHVFPKFKIRSFHLGADINRSIPTIGLTEDAENLLKVFSSKPIFLMVSTLAPHKGHKQVLDAFELLWSTGAELNLVIVGKEGWRVEELVKRLRNHSELNKRLFWLEGISDEFLLKVYSTSTCLIAASYGEGFGLPLIEAAQHKLPIIARDIPIFREVASNYAYYFKAEEPHELMRSILCWLDLHRHNNHPKSENMPWLTWRESANQLIKTLKN